MAKISRNDIRLLPHNDEAEKAVIGSLLIDPDGIYRTATVDLKPEHFYSQALGWVFEAAQTLMLQGKPVDIVTISDHLASEKQSNGQSRLDAIGGNIFLTGLINATPTSVHIEHYAQIVVNDARRRTLLSAAGDIAALAGEDSLDIDELMSRASSRFMPAVSVEGRNSHIYGTDSTLLRYLETQQQRSERLNRDPQALLITGLDDLDRILGELMPGYLHVVAARSSIGKTMYMECVAETNARRGKRVAFYHLELGYDMMLDRTMARHSGVPISELRRGYDGRELSEAIDKIAPWFRNIVFVHCPGWSAERIAADVQRLKMLGECDIAIVDYLQKIALPTTHSGLNQAALYGIEAEALKICAETCQIPIVLGSQVSRDYKYRDEKRPHMEDIRNSGEIEEKANQIVILHRPQERDPNLHFGDTEMLEAAVEKNTCGGIGIVQLVHVVGRYILGSVEKANA